MTIKRWVIACLTFIAIRGYATEVTTGINSSYALMQTGETHPIVRTNSTHSSIAPTSSQAITIPPITPPTSKEKGIITYIGMSHEDQKSVDRHLPDLDAAYAQAKMHHRKFALAFDNGGPNIFTSNDPQALRDIEAATGGDLTAMQRLEREWFPQRNDEEKKLFLQTQEGKTPTKEGNMAGVAAWAAKNKIPFYLEDISSRDWMSDQMLIVVHNRAIQLLAETGLETEQNRTDFFELFDLYSKLSAKMFDARNKAAAKQAVDLAAKGYDVVVMMGVIHEGVAEALESNKEITFQKGKTNRNPSTELYGSNLVIKGEMLKRPVLRPQRERLYLEELLMSVMRAEVKQYGKKDQLENSILIPLLSQWKTDELFALTMVIKSETQHTYIQTWLKSHTLTKEQKILFGLTD